MTTSYNDVPVMVEWLEWNGKVFQKRHKVIRLWAATLSHQFYTNGLGKRQTKIQNIQIFELDPLLMDEGEHLCKLQDGQPSKHTGGKL
jgi:hypothetical protein